MYQKYGLIRHWIAAISLCVSGSVLANDLIIERFDVSMNVDSVQQTSAFGYGPILNNVDADIELEVSIDDGDLSLSYSDFAVLAISEVQ